MFKRSPSLTEQVKSHLKQRIINAEFEAGRIPSENHLATELNVSRNTIRDALSRLEMEGIIFRRQGAGTFVNPANLLIKTRLEEIVPYDILIREHGYTPDVKLIKVEEREAESDLLAALNLSEKEPVVLVHKLFLADGSPVIFNCTWIPQRLITRSYTEQDFKAPMYQFLPQFCEQTLAYFLTDIIPLLPPMWLIERLDLPQNQTALLSFEEIGHNQDNEPLIKAISYFRDDLLRLRLMRRQVL